MRKGSGKPGGLPAVLVAIALVCGTLSVTVVPADAGSTWSIAPSPSPFRPDEFSLSAVSCADATNCFAVGTRPDLNGDYGAGEAGMVIEHWNGTTWLPAVGPISGEDLNAV